MLTGSSIHLLRRCKRHRTFNNLLNQYYSLLFCIWIPKSALSLMPNGSVIRKLPRGMSLAALLRRPLHYTRFTYAISRAKYLCSGLIMIGKVQYVSRLAQNTFSWRKSRIRGDCTRPRRHHPRPRLSPNCYKTINKPTLIRHSGEPFQASTTGDDFLGS